ncbi:DDE-type integrase/transposase/recombinase [Acidiferrobacter thiooxydans]|uniref:Integrase n=1 Tax=Acidiferrobacter thiooxydans TaxID=163359 RepID=A0A1C2G2L6_9GAMM|nr:integrase [Acidiferrobacter thiooxydans]RCN59457.1 integrase [Acidiferrobacter thiooxydans]RCN59461.1 integrase [Acidiferrobacter thiooxydans]
MIVTLKTQGLQTLEHIRAFLEGTQPLGFEAPAREVTYEWIVAELRRLRYTRQGKADKGLVRRYLEKVSGLSRAQMTRLIQQFRDTGRIRDRRGPPAKPFARRYTPADVRLLAELDALHGALSGPATRKLCERAYEVFDDARYERLARISNGHLYNLRQSQTYRRVRGAVDKTHPVKVNIGERRKPRPEGRPGFLRVDSVHQGDLDGIKGLYHINLVDEVSQFQFVGSVERISEHFLLPVLEALIEAFPFVVLGFHADNGSEYINTRVVALLEKLRIEQFTKSRARRTNDNALVESKNGSVVRKHLGYAHIPGRFASQVNAFTQGVLSPYLNFHRPCFFPTEAVDDKGRVRKRYRYEDMMTPYDKLKSLPEAHQYLKPGITFKQLDAIAYAISDNEAAQRLNQARAELFRSINKAQNPAA